MNDPGWYGRFRCLPVLWTVLMASLSVVRGQDDGVAFFEKHVRPLLIDHCYDCHSAEERSGGLRVDARDFLLAGGDSGPAVVPGHAGDSLLLEAVRYSNPALQMPPEERLSDAQIRILEQWIDRGLPDPRTAAPEDLQTPSVSSEDVRDFWSLQPVAAPPIPMVRDERWVQTPIDAFVLQRLEAVGLQPAPAADPRTLIRRVTLDLTGLLPTPEQVDAFVRDPSDRAWESLVSRLLASPQYGERWGRHWLDVARYADSNGLDENIAFGHAWRYRDYVMESFRTNKPFDRFLTEQLAGDLLPDADQETLTATGFLQLGAKVLAEPDREKLVMDTIDEQIDVTGKVFLGLTLGCARCHDHKFDPLTQADYYALAAIFRSTRTFAEKQQGAIRFWYEHSFATEEERERMKPVDQAIAEKKAAAARYKSDAMTALRKSARRQAADYLAAAVSVDPDDPLSRFETVARDFGVHPRILHHCRTHLHYHRYDPVFAPWDRLREQGPDAVRSHYAALFSRVDAAWKARRQKTPDAAALDDPFLESVRKALEDPAGFLAVPARPADAFDADTLARYNALMEEARLLESTAPDLPAAMGVTEQDTVTELPIHIRGSHLNLGRPVPRAVPAVLCPTQAPVTFPDDQSGRRELAEWLTDPDHPLTARVFVNRVWNWHFGRGIVATTENFGRLGARPTHPELLDWLAHRFIQSGWDIKRLHRDILLSSCYRMDSIHPQAADAAAIDPANDLLWTFRMQRMDAEQIRDCILQVSGRLDMTSGGKTVPLRNRQFVFNHTSRDHTKYDSLRRAVYLPVIRNNLYTLFQQFDFPDPTVPTGHRGETVVAPQALWAMNSELILSSSDAMAAALMKDDPDPRQAIRTAWIRIMGRPATEDEIRQSLAFIEQAADAHTTAAGPDPAALQDAWSAFCQSLLSANEFLFIR